MSWYRFEPKPSVGQRRAQAVRAFEQLKKQGKTLEPVIIEGTKIARTFWGQAWCDNLEAYRDFEYRLPRGRSYVRHRAVLDLEVQPGQINAQVQGSSTYRVTVKIKPLPTHRWAALKQHSAGRIASLIELLKGELSDHVIRQIIDRDHGLFPSPDEIEMSCSCPDWAGMCKHVAAAMYGVGHRLDTKPDLLFTLRKLDPTELIAHATRADALATHDAAQPTIRDDQLADVFGIDLADPAPDATPTRLKKAKKRPTKKATKKKVKKRAAAKPPRAKNAGGSASVQNTGTKKLTPSKAKKRK